MSEQDRPHADLTEQTRLQKALRESVILRELADILNSSLDLEHILQELVKRTTELCEVARCAVWLMDEAGERFRPITYYLADSSLSSQKLRATDAAWYRSHLSLHNPAIVRLLNGDGMLQIDDLRAEAGIQFFARTFQVHSVLLIALLHHGRPLGLMSLDNPGRLRPFSPEQQQRARAIAQQATIAIHNASLYQQAQAQQRRAEHLIERARAVYQVAMSVNSGKDLPVVLTLATEHLARSLHADAGLAMSLDIEQAELRPVASLSLDQRDLLAERGFTLGHLPNFWHAIQTGTMLLLADEQARDQEINWLRSFNARTLLLVPLMGGSSHQKAGWDLSGAARALPPAAGVETKLVYCLGLIVLSYPQRYRPTAGEYAFAQDIAAQCALAIEKNRLLVEAHQAAVLATERASTLDAVFQAMNEGIAVITSDEQVFIRNHAMAGFLGAPLYSSSPLKTFVQEHPVYTLDEQPISYEDFPITRALHDGTQVRGERIIAMRADGSLRTVELTASPLRDGQGQPIGLVCAVRDITVAVRAEQRIRQALDTFLHIAAAVSHSMDIREILHIVLAETLKTLHCTRGTVHLFQQGFKPLLSLGFTPYEEDQWLQKQEIWLNPQTGQEYGFFARLMDGNATLVSADHCPVQPNPFADTLVLAAPIKHDRHILGLILLDRSLSGVVNPAQKRFTGFTNWDLTIIAGIAQLVGTVLEQTRCQQEASDARASEAIMREANAMKNEFLAITAHEFRNPLTVILARSQSAQRAMRRAHNGGDPLPAIEEHLKIITAQGKQLNNIVTTFLDAARIDQGQLKLKTELLDLASIARQVVEEQAVLAERHSLSCIVAEDSQPYMVMGDQARLHQVLANLVENAIKYSPEGGSVTIHLQRSRTRGFVEISVEDKGTGIPLEAQARLFERFYRVPQLAKNATHGVGLGLYIVAQLVEMHGGQIIVESSGIPGEGSRFVLTLPVPAGAESQDINQATPQHNQAR